jgi:hypothetical protein
MFVGKTLEPSKVEYLSVWLLTLLANFRLVCNSLPGTNTLAYLPAVSMTKKEEKVL